MRRRRRAPKRSSTHERAGEQSLRQLAHEEAAQYFERGLALAAATGAARCDLLFGLAEALRRAGDVTGARDAFIEAGAIARALGDAERLARAAIGELPRPRVREPRVARARDRPAGRGAHRAARIDDDPLRARVLAALGLEVYFTSNQERANVVSAAGVEMARRLGDDEALAFCLACRHTAIFDPGHLHDRLEVAAELIEVGARIGEPRTRAHRARAPRLRPARVGAGRRGPGGGRGVAATLVEELGQPALRYFVLWLQSTLALIEGLFEDAEKLAHESFELGVAANHPDAAVVYGTQLVIFAWQRGDTTALVEPTLDILTRVPDLPAWRSALALVLALGGRPEEARAELLRATQSLDNLTFTSTWTPALIGLAEVARLLDEPERGGHGSTKASPRTPTA